MRQIESLQVLRGLSAWMVVYHHYMQAFHNFNGGGFIGKFFSQTGNFGVDLFFVLSGFIMYYTIHTHHYSAKEFLLRRLIRIVPVYWFMTLAFIAVLYLFPTPATTWNVRTLILSLLFLPHQNPSGIGLFPLLTVGWTLNFEMFFYTWLSLIMALLGRRWVLGFLATILLLPQLSPSGWWYSAIIGDPILYEFAFGVIAGWLYGHRPELSNAGTLILGAILFGAGVILYTRTNCCSGMHVVWRLGAASRYVAAALFVSSAVSIESYIAKLPGTGIWRHLGDISYSTYLVHPLCLTACLYVFGQPKSWALDGAAIAIYSLLTLALSLVSYRWIETGRVSELLKRHLLAKRHILAVVDASSERAPLPR